MKKLFSFIFLLCFCSNPGVAFASTSSQVIETDNEELNKFYRNFQYAWKKEYWIFPSDFPQNPKKMDRKILKGILDVLKGPHNIRTIVEGDHLYRIFDRYNLTADNIQPTYKIYLSTDEEKTYDEKVGCIHNKITVLGNYWWYNIDDGKDHKFSIIIFHTLLSQAFQLPVEARQKFTQGQLAHSRLQASRPPSTQVNGKDIGRIIYRQNAKEHISNTYTSAPIVTITPPPSSKSPDDQVQYRAFHEKRTLTSANFSGIYSQAKQATTQHLSVIDDVTQKPAEKSQKSSTLVKRARTSGQLIVQRPNKLYRSPGGKVKQLKANFEKEAADTDANSDLSSSRASREKNKVAINPSPLKEEKTKDKEITEPEK